MPWDGQAPRDGEWSLLSWISKYRPGPHTWFDGKAGFRATLQFDYFERGRSKAHAVFTDLEGKKYPVSITDLADIIKAGHSLMECEGHWVVRKQGANYLLGMKDVNDG